MMRNIVRICQKDPHLTSSELANSFNSGLNSNLSASTLRRNLNSIGLRSYSAIKKPALTKSMKRKRLEWCRAHENWSC